MVFNWYHQHVQLLQTSIERFLYTRIVSYNDHIYLSIVLFVVQNQRIQLI